MYSLNTITVSDIKHIAAIAFGLGFVFIVFFALLRSGRGKPGAKVISLEEWEEAIRGNHKTDKL